MHSSQRVLSYLLSINGCEVAMIQSRIIALTEPPARGPAMLCKRVAWLSPVLSRLAHKSARTVDLGGYPSACRLPRRPAALLRWAGIH